MKKPLTLLEAFLFIALFIFSKLLPIIFNKSGDNSEIHTHHFRWIWFKRR